VVDVLVEYVEEPPQQADYEGDALREPSGQEVYV